MKIIIAPAKKMTEDEVHDFTLTVPLFEKEAEFLMKKLTEFTPDERLSIYGCSSSVLEPFNQQLDLLCKGRVLSRTPALLAYSGLAFQSMAPNVFTNEQWEYVQKHLWILSAMFGILRPFDGIWTYRLDMMNQPLEDQSLYDFWKPRLKSEFEKETIINLASKEYAKLISNPENVIDIHFYQIAPDGKKKETAVYAKQARGTMVSWMAENHIEEPEKIKNFDELGYQYNPHLSTDSSYCFVRPEPEKKSRKTTR